MSVRSNGMQVPTEPFIMVTMLQYFRREKGIKERNVVELSNLQQFEPYYYKLTSAF